MPKVEKCSLPSKAHGLEGLMRQSEAKLLVCSEWSRWLKRHPKITDPNGNQAFVFYNYLVFRLASHVNASGGRPCQ